MFSYYKRNFINKYKDSVQAYIGKVYEAPPRPPERFSVRYALTIPPETTDKDSDIKYSDRESDIQFSLKPSTKPEDKFDAAVVSDAMKSYLAEQSPAKPLSATINLTFVDKLLSYIREKDLTEPEVYKAAQIDRRLFSKIISNKDYKPSKDTVLAFIFALRLTLGEGKDLLERAGYTLSHSIRRDIILEYFIKERVYNLNNINAFLYNMSEKIIGRNI